MMMTIPPPYKSHQKPRHSTVAADKMSHPKRRSRRKQKMFVTVAIFLLVVECYLLQKSLKFQEAPTSEIVLGPNAISGRTHSGNNIPSAPRSPDGTFHTYPVYYQNVSAISHTKPVSIQHCLGENYQSTTSWMHRSCHFKFMCFNMTSREFQVYQRKSENTSSSGSTFEDSSQSFLSEQILSVSLGGINPKWGRDGINRLKWFPTVLSEPPIEFYSLPSSVVLVPFHSLAGWNPGHGVWDDFLPIFTLANMFQFDTPDYELFALRYTLQGDPLWASCDFHNKAEICQWMQRKFWPLLNNRTTPVSRHTVPLHIHNGNAKSELVCAKNGLMGIGALTDHGTSKLHGWLPEDYKITQNHGRGGLLWRFRSFCLQNLGFSASADQKLAAPYKIVFSVQSSSNRLRNLDFTEQESLLQRRFESDEAIVQSVVMKNLTLQEQIQLAQETTIFVTGCGGGAVTATFLPKGATLIVFYNEVGGRKSNVPTNLPARLDWDLFNHMSYLRVHWFPSGTMNSREDMNSLYDVIRADLSRRNLGI